MLPEVRRGLLRRYLEEGRSLRLLEAHSGISAMIASSARAGEKEFDGLWISSLTESALHGLPDREIQGFESRLQLIQAVLGVTAKPVLVDGDTGGTLDQVTHRCRVLEAMGVSGLVMEDKRFPKRNSFDPVPQELESISEFSEKICRARAARSTRDFLVVARVEALIVGCGQEEALTRALAYREAGADAVLLHSKSADGADALAVAARFRARDPTTPLICVPTTYHCLTDSALFSAGFSVVIHANHMLRAAMQAMTAVATGILGSDRSLEMDALCTPIRDLLRLTRQGFEPLDDAKAGA